ncbi:peptidoglycan-binding domain-containing protein [Peribacillus muralis]|uniref:peptidoglycan-binding domain-containing protein n=1 Tax=Peribacillus muralis TaxID=264697 RepID=UPI00366ABCD2
MGFYTDSAIVDVDGIFGPETEAGVKKYQKENYLKVDGVLGPRTASLKILRRMSRTPMEQAEIWGSELNGSTTILPIHRALKPIFKVMGIH